MMCVENEKEIQMNNSVQPYISVILPSLNVKEYIAECLESVQRQTLDNIEIICVDAGSTDGTWEYLISAAEKDQRITVYHSEVKSYGKQVNFGIEKAKGKYIGIVETDDYICEDMYRKLYEMAEQSEADYVKTNFTHYAELRSGKRIFLPDNVLPEELFNVKLMPGEHGILYYHDWAVWRGLYRRSFLTEKSIRFSESMGASFQDIGFQLQILSKAKCAVYLKDHDYQYCVSRPGASTHSKKTLGFCYYEYNRYKTEFLSENASDIKGYYLKMLGSIVGVIKNLARVLNDEEWRAYQEPIAWFTEQIDQALLDGCYEEFDWIPLRFQLKEYEKFRKAPEAYIKAVNDRKKLEEEQFEQVRKKGKAIIFGAGIRGKRLYIELDKRGIKPIAVLDNDKALAGHNIDDVMIEYAVEAIDRYKDGIFIIANRYYSMDIKIQLLQSGIKEENIIIFEG